MNLNWSDNSGFKWSPYGLISLGLEKALILEAYSEMIWSITRANNKDWEKQTVKVWLIMRLESLSKVDGSFFPEASECRYISNGRQWGMLFMWTKLRVPRTINPAWSFYLGRKSLCFLKNEFILRKIVLPPLSKLYEISSAFLIETGKSFLGVFGLR